MARRRTLQPEETEAFKAEAVTDPLCGCRVLPTGQVVPTGAAIEAADQAAREATAWREYEARRNGSPRDQELVDPEQAEHDYDSDEQAGGDDR